MEEMQKSGQTCIDEDAAMGVRQSVTSLAIREIVAYRNVIRLEKVQIDQMKEYWDRRPCNIRHSPRPIGTKEYFDEVEARKYFVEPHIPAFAEFDRWKGKKTLEIGVGSAQTR